MINSKNGILIALIAPIIALAILTGYKKYILTSGTEVTLPITGYDPRDLLSGHYLIYRIKYGIENICPGTTKQTAYVCLEPKKFSYQRPQNCQLMIKGICSPHRFQAGIERFYIPQDQAKHLEDRVIVGDGSIVLSITKNGKAQIKDLLINGKSWRDQ